MHPWPGGHPHIAMPIVLPGDKVLLSSGYGTGSELLEVKQSEGKWTVNRLWKSVRLKSKFANLFHRDGFIYGLDDGIMACIDARDGSLKWKEGRYGHGQMIEVGDVLGVMAESGDWVWVRMNPEKHEELAKFSVLKGKTWNPPALAGKYLLVRNDREAACFELE
jgi:outer membrane protein assembly factor BamB